MMISMRFCTIRTKTAVLHNLTLYLLALSEGSSTIITESLIHCRHNTTHTSASEKRALRKNCHVFFLKIYTYFQVRKHLFDKLKQIDDIIIIERLS